MNSYDLIANVDYVSPLTQWDKKAMVRTPASPIIRPGGEQGGYFFKPALVPITKHPRVAALGYDITRVLQVMQLRRYLHYTEVLELEIVNPALLKIISSDLPSEIRRDAYKIYIDEGYHALMAVDLREQIRSTEAVGGVELPYPVHLCAVQGIIQSLPQGLHDIAAVFAATTNELLISANLAQAEDVTLMSCVREMIRDHAVDEAVHHKYFARIFPILWSQLDASSRCIIGMLLSEFILYFMAADEPSIALDLECCGFSQSEALEIVKETYSEDPAPAARHAARAALSVFKRSGVFSVRSIRDGFVRRGLMDYDYEKTHAMSVTRIQGDIHQRLLKR